MVKLGRSPVHQSSQASREAMVALSLSSISSLRTTNIILSHGQPNTLLLSCYRVHFNGGLSVAGSAPVTLWAVASAAGWVSVLAFGIAPTSLVLRPSSVLSCRDFPAGLLVALPRGCKALPPSLQCK